MNEKLKHWIKYLRLSDQVDFHEVIRKINLKLMNDLNFFCVVPLSGSHGQCRLCAQAQ